MISYISILFVDHIIISCCIAKNSFLSKYPCFFQLYIFQVNYSRLLLEILCWLTYRSKHTLFFIIFIIIISSSSSSSSKVVPTPRLGILLLGLGIRDSDVPSGHYNISAEETAKICKEMFSRHVVNPAKNVGYEVDFFAHSWNPEAEESMNRLFKPVKSIYEKYTGPRSKPGFMEWMDWRPEHFYDLEEGVSMVSR